MTRHLNLEVLGNSIGGNLVLSTSADDVGGELTDVEGQTKLADFAEITGKKFESLKRDYSVGSLGSVCTKVHEMLRHCINTSI